MPWVRIDEHALNHVKILALSHGAFRLWVEGLAHCQKHLTDGKITRNDLKTFRYVSRARVDQLLCALWRLTDDGFEVNDYLVWNESRAAVLLARTKAQERMAKLRGGSPEQAPEHASNERQTTNDVRLSTPLPLKTEEKIKSVSSEPNTAHEPVVVDASPSLLVFPTIGANGAQWHLREAQRAEWAALFPAVEILGEARKALAWLQANPTKRKTAKGMPRFLVAWLTRCVDRGGTSGPTQSSGYRPFVSERRDVLDADQTAALLAARRRERAEVLNG